MCHYIWLYCCIRVPLHLAVLLHPCAVRFYCSASSLILSPYKTTVCRNSCNFCNKIWNRVPLFLEYNLEPCAMTSALQLCISGGSLELAPPHNNPPVCRKVLIRNLNENKARACESLLEKNDRRFTRNALAMLLSPYKTAVCRYFFDMPLSTVCHCICTANCRRVLLHLRRLVPPCATKLISVPTCPALCNHYKIKRGTRPYQ